MATAKLIDLILDTTVYPRNEISGSTVQSLVDAIEMNDPVPPIVVDKASMRVVDGFHRYHAYKRLKRESIPVVLRTYKNEAELFADAVRLNRAHGRSFDPYDLRRAVQKLSGYGFKDNTISDIIRIPRARIEQFKGEFAKGPRGTEIVLKRGLVQELKGRSLTKEQVQANDRYSGYQPSFHVNQLIAILKADVIPKSEAFTSGMDELCSLWSIIRSKKSA
jgi:ParB-like chromosome segregation protein Spo0J